MPRRPHLAQSVEHIVEEEQYLPFRYLGDVVQAFTGVVPDPRILVVEAG